jgi:hypothetical protein
VVEFRPIRGGRCCQLTTARRCVKKALLAVGRAIER